MKRKSNKYAPQSITVIWKKCKEYEYFCEIVIGNSLFEQNFYNKGKERKNVFYIVLNQTLSKQDHQSYSGAYKP